MSIVARRLAVRGRVQGVGFRDGMCRFAREAGATGWVPAARKAATSARSACSSQASVSLRWFACVARRNEMTGSTKATASEVPRKTRPIRTSTMCPRV